MQNYNNDKFEISAKPSFEQENSANFFLSENVSKPDTVDFSEPARRLNDYDSNLLKEDAYKDVSDDLFRLEYKISRIEDEIKTLDLQIQAAIDIQDYDLSGELSGRQLILKEDYEALLAMYKEKSFSAKLSNVFGDRFKPQIDSLKNNISKISDKLIQKLPKRISSVLELKKSLIKLENISKSVDDLISMNIPYGENIDKYDQLSKYIIKANSIQNDLSKLIK